jgi:hypothetical protein
VVGGNVSGPYKGRGKHEFNVPSSRKIVFDLNTDDHIRGCVDSGIGKGDVDRVELSRIKEDRSPCVIGRVVITHMNHKGISHDRGGRIPDVGELNIDKREVGESGEQAADGDLSKLRE